MRFFLLLLCFLITACEEAAPPAPKQEEAEDKPPALILEPVAFDALPDWGRDGFQTFIPAFERSCRRIARKPGDQPFGALGARAGTYADWKGVCEDFAMLDFNDAQALQRFFETRFTPYSVRADEKETGLFTGYYEASLRGSKTRTAQYNIPLHKRPDDLVMVHLGQFREALKGQRIAGRVRGGTLVPYESREDIVAGNWPHEDEVLVWVDSAVDAFFVQIQGSGLVEMADGSVMRIGYAGQNGHPYYAIGRELIKMGALTRDNVSMQTIRQWLEENPDQADAVMNTNQSYVFFREIDGEGPIGAEGVALTAGRSLAVDRTRLSYGLPLWVDIEKPVEGTPPIRRLMIAQDTGGAIIGPVRGDVFWGYGPQAEDIAGKMASQGRYWALIPSEITPDTHPFDADEDAAREDAQK